MQDVICEEFLFVPEGEAALTHYGDAATGRESGEHAVQVQGVIGEKVLLAPEVEANPTHYGGTATGRESVDQAAQVQDVICEKVLFVPGLEANRGHWPRVRCECRACAGRVWCLWHDETGGPAVHGHDVFCLSQRLRRTPGATETRPLAAGPLSRPRRCRALPATLAG